MVLKLSVVATSTSMRAARSARAQTMPESIETSPDWMPWVMTGRSAARLSEGLAMPSSRLTAAVAPAADRKERRVSDARLRRVTAIGPPPSNHGGPCVRRLTATQHFCDGHVKQESVVSNQTIPGGPDVAYEPRDGARNGSCRVRSAGSSVDGASSEC
jgi:hypothetical protein